MSPKSKYLRQVVFSLLTGFLLWVGLSPRAAQVAYNEALMPRCRPEHRDVVVRVKTSTTLVPFSVGSRKLAAYLHVSSQSNKLVVFYGGRRSNIEKSWIRVQALAKTGVSVLFCEYRGFGDTAGLASLRSLREDGLAAFDAASKLGYAPENIIVYGESLGTAVATHVASQRQIGGLILQSGFSSLESQVKDMIPFLRLYPRCLFPKPEMSSAKNLKPGHAPLLIIHGDEDDVVNVKHARVLAEAAGADTELVILRGATHCDVFARNDWLETVQRFVASLGVSPVFEAA